MIFRGLIALTLLLSGCTSTPRKPLVKNNSVPKTYKRTPAGIVEEMLSKGSLVACQALAPRLNGDLPPEKFTVEVVRNGFIDFGKVFNDNKLIEPAVELQSLPPCPEGAFRIGRNCASGGEVSDNLQVYYGDGFELSIESKGQGRIIFFPEEGEKIQLALQCKHFRKPNAPLN
ncbi:MAG: hypothetical protein AB7O96_02675 [Pseudobdellovibrionaceae bacterium]